MPPPSDTEQVPAPSHLNLQLRLLEGRQVRVPLCPAEVLVWLARPSGCYTLVNAISVATERQAMGAQLHCALPWHHWEPRQPTHLHVQGELSDDGTQLALFITPGTDTSCSPAVQGLDGVELVFEQGEASQWLDLLSR